MTDATHNVRIFDTTLRDGEQSPGASLNRHEKVEIARQLEALGVDIIEAGFPITSQGDFEAVQAIGDVVSRPVVCGLARSVPKDIIRAGEALKNAQKKRIHIFCATSKIHREHKLRKAIDEITKISVDSVKLARDYVTDIEFSPEDASRTELNVLVDITAAVIEAGATTINLPDTVGYAVPEEYGFIFKHLREQLPVIDQKGIILSAHCHNDLGLAVANSLAAVANGARQIECTINGIGERAGNCSLEEIVMAMKTRADYYKGYSNGIVTKKLFPTSKMVSTFTGIHVQRNKAIVGENAFAHESGIHQDGILKERSTYEIMDPLEVGLPENKLVLGKHSGRHAFKDRVIFLGLKVDDQALDKAFEAFKTLADKKKSVYDEDIEAIIDQSTKDERQLWELVKFHVTSGSDVDAVAMVTLRDSAGHEQREAAVGDGPIDAVYSAIQRITRISTELLDFETRAVTEGKEAQGESTVQIRHNTRTVRGRGLSTDVIEAAIRAYLSAINRIKTTDAKSVAATSATNP
jgi:2-isopropylmalate synthase